MRGLTVSWGGETEASKARTWAACFCISGESLSSLSC